VELNGRLATINATNKTRDEIKAFELIKVVTVVSNTIYVEKK